MKFLVLLCTLGALLLAPGLAVAQPELDPTPFFPSEAELPAGFTEIERTEERATQPGLMGIQRQYIRFNPEVAEDDITLMAIRISVADTPARAREAYRELEIELMWIGMTMETLDEPLGEEAAVARVSIGSAGRTDGEIVEVFFRSGRYNVGVTWLDYIDLPNLEDALAVARMIAAKLPS